MGYLQLGIRLDAKLFGRFDAEAKRAKRSKTDIVASLIDRWVGTEVFARRRDVWFGQGVRGTTPESVEDAATEAGNATHGALVGLFEHLEHKNLCRGNGHHMAQEMAHYAARLVRERWVDDETILQGSNQEQP